MQVLLWLSDTMHVKCLEHTLEHSIFTLVAITIINKLKGILI